MSKFALLVIFLVISLNWLYQPFPIDHNDTMIDQYRPSLYKNHDTHATDSLFKVKTNYGKHATAFHVPKAMKLVQLNN